MSNTKKAVRKKRICNKKEVAKAKPPARKKRTSDSNTVTRALQGTITTKKGQRDKLIYGDEYNFGSILQTLRCKSGLTQSEVATKLKIQPPTLSNYERDIQKPSICLLMDMANLFNVDLNTLVGHKASIKTKIYNSYNLLHTHHRKTLVEMADHLLFKQNGASLHLTNYNKKTPK
jgi:transcriptional regulator with XRE-family HTH domain